LDVFETVKRAGANFKLQAKADSPQRLKGLKGARRKADAKAN